LLKYGKSVNISSVFLKTQFFLKRSTKPFEQNLNALKRFFKKFLKSPMLPKNDQEMPEKF